MQSNQEPGLTTPSSSVSQNHAQPPSLIQPPAEYKPAASPSNNKPLPTGNLDIKPIQEGESLMDFIKKNSQFDGDTPTIVTQSPAIDTPKGAPEASNPSPTAHLNGEYPSNGTTQSTNPVPKEDEKEPAPDFSNPEAAPKEESSDGKTSEEGETDENDPLMAEPAETPAREAFKSLQTKFKEARKTLKEKEKALEKATLDLKNLNEGKHAPEVVAEKDKEISRLKAFEQIVNLKSSPEYQEKLKPVEEKKSRLKNLFNEYGVPVEEQDGLVNRTINATSEKALNEFLSDTFDPVAAIEVKGLIGNIKEGTQELKRLESSPAESLQALQKEGQAIRERQDIERKTKIYSDAQSSWGKSLNRIREQGKIKELIPSQDPEFNRKFVNPILKQASDDYARTVKELAASGATDLPETLLEALALSHLQAHAAGLAVHTRDNAIQEIRTLEEGTQRLNGLLRPAVGGGQPRSNIAPQKQRDETPEEAAMGVLNSVLSKKK